MGKIFIAKRFSKVNKKVRVCHKTTECDKMRSFAVTFAVTRVYTPEVKAGAESALRKLGVISRYLCEDRLIHSMLKTGNKTGKLRMSHGTHYQL